MAKPLAILDTSVVLFLLTEPGAEDSGTEAERRRLAVEEVVTDLQKTRRFAIPAAAVAELGRDGDPKDLVDKISAQLARLRILALDYGSSRIAGRLSTLALRGRAKGEERGAVKFDALICATAVHHGADCIVTENPRDFRRLLQAIGSTIDVIVPSVPPEKGQLKLVQTPPKKGGITPPASPPAAGRP